MSVDFNSTLNIWVDKVNPEQPLKADNESWQAGRHIAASHHKPVSMCHTLQRNFRKSPWFIGSCGGTKWRVNQSLNKATDSMAYSSNRSRSLNDAFNVDGNVRLSTLSYLNTVTDYIEEIVVRVRQGQSRGRLGLWRHRRSHTAACICAREWRLTPGKTSVCSKVRGSDGPNEAGLLSRGSHVSIHTSGLKGDCKILWMKWKMRFETPI